MLGEVPQKSEGQFWQWQWSIDATTEQAETAVGTEVEGTAVIVMIENL